MSTFIIIVGVLGGLLTLLSLFDGARYLAALSRWDSKAIVMPSTIWVETTAPALATVFLFLLQHWVFSIVVLFKLVVFFIVGLSKEEVKEEKYQRWGVLFHYGFGFIDGVILSVGPAIILTLSLTAQSAGSPTLWSWYLPALIAAFVVGHWIANIIFSTGIGALSALFSQEEHYENRSYLLQTCQ